MSPYSLEASTYSIFGSPSSHLFKTLFKCLIYVASNGSMIGYDDLERTKNEVFVA